MNAYTRQDLSVMQAWPLERKIRVTQAKIIEWYHHYGGKVAVSFSGGKDSTVLLDLARRAFPDIPAVFVDTGLEYPEIREFVKTVPNVTWLRPEMPFSKVILEYGYPVISKDVARRIRYARKGGTWALCHLNGLNRDGTPSKYNERYMKWRILLDAPFFVSDQCCFIMKERPLHRYNQETGRKQIIATMACESARRQSVYLKIGCNAYHKRDPTSQPMSFWTEQDVLAYAEIKALCAGDERIREKMDLDVDVARLRLMKANHQSQQYRLEDNILRHFPAQIEENRGFLSGFETDMKTLEAHPHPKDGFAGMEVKGDLLTDKDNAGAALLEAFKDAKGLEPVPIGSYRGFSMSLTVENFGKDFILTLKGKMSHRVELGKDARGNLVRIDNALAQMPERYKTVQGRLENVQAQLATAKAELGKPFPQETELKEKSARLAELNAELNIDDRTPMEQAAENVVAKRPSVLGKLKAPSVHGAGEKKKSHEQEAR